MARDRRPRDAFGRPLDPGADFGTGASSRFGGALGSAPGATGGPNAAPSGDGVVETDDAPAPRTAFGADEAPATRPSSPSADGVGRARPWEEQAGRSAGGDAVNPQATVALVLGVLGLVVVPYLLSIAAIVVANRADRVADALPGAPGRSAARTGRILGYVGLGLWLLLPLLFVLLLLVTTTGTV